MPRPLTGVRVLDFTIFQQGPQATMVMADMGADVIKVEPPGFGDLGRVLQMHGEHRLSAYHLAHSRGKRSLTVHLKTDGGREIVRRLLPSMDVMVHNFRPGVMEKLGFGYEEVRALNPGIIYAHASGWGGQGPKTTHPAFDIAAQARSGLMSMTGEADGGPLPVGVAIADYVGAMNLAMAVIAALYARDRRGGDRDYTDFMDKEDGVHHRGTEAQRVDGGERTDDAPRAGQKIETSLFGSAIAAQAWEIQAYILGRRKRRSGRGHAYLPTIWRTFKTADGWAVIGGVGDDRWPAFCAAVGMPELEQDERFANAFNRIVNIDALYALLDDKFLVKTTAEWIPVLESHDMICAPVQDYETLLDDPQALANEYVLTVEHPTNGPTQIVGFPWKFSETPAVASAAAPELGQHTEEILLDLGYTWEEIGA
ncbi:MAG: CoA transferase, partial [Chloroflexota bacterium]